MGLLSAAGPSYAGTGCAHRPPGSLLTRLARLSFRVPWWSTRRGCWRWSGRVSACVRWYGSTFVSAAALQSWTGYHPPTGRHPCSLPVPSAAVTLSRCTTTHAPPPCVSPSDAFFPTKFALASLSPPHCISANRTVPHPPTLSGQRCWSSSCLFTSV